MPRHSGFLASATRLSAGCAFCFALTRGGWYRPGGMIRADGTRVSDDLERWADEALSACDGDLAECIERHAAEDLLEIEELQEVLDRRRIDPARLPTDYPGLLAHHRRRPPGWR